MSEKAAAAQKWAEAKEILDATMASLEQLTAACNEAQANERAAWEALEALAGRTVAPLPDMSAYETALAKAQAPGQNHQLHHSLGIRPLG